MYFRKSFFMRIVIHNLDFFVFEIPLTLEIEPGMKNGDQIKFEDVADEQVGHTPGDLIIELAAEKHEFFTRKGKFLHDVPCFLRGNIPRFSFKKRTKHTISASNNLNPNQLAAGLSKPW